MNYLDQIMTNCARSQHGTQLETDILSDDRPEIVFYVLLKLIYRQHFTIMVFLIIFK